MTTQKTVFVGLSGGVDSAVAALRLQKEGYAVVGVFIKVWHPDFLVCNWEEERLDAMRVAAHLDIPFLTCDAEEAYQTEVGDYFVREYMAGRTPNPDVMCNKAVKFGAFLSFAKEHGADMIATGHYAQVKDSRLLRGVDADKDQSYFLWTLTQEQLAHVLLPVGDSTKKEIRAEAARAGIPTAAKKDSQGICFLGHVDIPEFMSHFVELKQGNVLNEKGEVIGTHNGALVYTLGQRHGFTVSNADTETRAHYVVGKDMEENTITIAEHPPVLPAQQGISLIETNWIAEVPKEGDEMFVQFRYRQTPARAVVSNIANDTCTIVPTESVERPAAGQSCVLYDREVCLGGGVVG
ncbi:MAG: tRNA 2-thiouridine(34) synthase MnmA [Candidatus Paceibacterota bacterium]